MRKIFGIFLFLILILHTFPAKSNAAVVNPPTATKCYYCPQITVGGFTYDGTAGELQQCLVEYLVYPSGDACDDDTYPGNYVCKYEPTNGTGNGHKYMTLANFSAVNGGVCSSSQTCIPTQGCKDSGSPDPNECHISGDGVNVLCDSLFDCTNNDPNCSENYCVNPEGFLFSEEDLNGPLGTNGGRCKKSTTPPTCRSGDNCDYSTFNTEGPDFECTDDSKCFSNSCDLSTHTCNRGITLLACKEKTRGVYVTEGHVEQVGTGVFTCQTAVGEISTDPEGFAQSVLKLVLGLAGGILLILIIINGYKLMTSQGDPEKIKEAREAIISAIAGLLLIIFSLAILRIITVDILKIPGFN